MSTNSSIGQQTGAFLLYQTEDEQTRVQVRLTVFANTRKPVARQTNKKKGLA